jgi:hypothetical protein
MFYRHSMRQASTQLGDFLPKLVMRIEELTKSTKKKVTRNEVSPGRVALNWSHGACQFFLTFG